MTGTVLIAGTGLIGTSIGLALAGDREVLLTDPDGGRLQAAVRRGAGSPWDGRRTVELAVVAAPPAITAAVIADLQRRKVATTFTHVASAQAHVQADLQSLNSDLSSVCGGHPLAGKELSGPGAAAADLFVGRPWVACPAPTTTQTALDAVLSLARSCGAEPTVLTAEAHDAAVAVSSHLAQVAASALAAQLLGSAPAAAAISGPGLQDTTRVAGSDPALWTEVLGANAAYVAPLVHALAADLAGAAAALDQLAAHPGDTKSAGVLRDLLERGNRGRALVPVKRGELDAGYAAVEVPLADQPGQLAGVFAAAAAAGVNIEDVRVEHLPGRPTGVVRLLVQDGQRSRLREALAAAGFDPAAPNATG